MMIEHKCHKGHATFSTKEGMISCNYTGCRLESHPIHAVVKNIFSRPAPRVYPVPEIIPPIPAPIDKWAGKEKSICECGRKKSPKASHCMMCARLLLPPPKKKYNPKKRKRSTFDPIQELEIKIKNAKRNIDNWEKMRIQYLRMREEMQKKEN